MDKEWDKLIKAEVYKNDVYSLKKTEFDRSPLYIIDIGANYGWFSYLASELYPNSNIYAYELIENNYKAAVSNLKEFKNVQVFNAGVIGDNKIVKICQNADNHGGHKSIYSGDASYNSEERFKSTKGTNVIHENIPDQISIKDIFEINKIDYIDFLKMDCEGCEYDLFDQIFKYDLDKRIKNLAFEIHGSGNPEYNKLLKEVEKRFPTFKKGKIVKASNI